MSVDSFLLAGLAAFFAFQWGLHFRRPIEVRFSWSDLRGALEDALPSESERSEPTGECQQIDLVLNEVFNDGFQEGRRTAFAEHTRPFCN